jgi:hypothetical protein
MLVIVAGLQVSTVTGGDQSYYSYCTLLLYLL